ncbi:Hypothetical predicted protein, partial [Olea europaea subsp. europaea]
GASGVDDHGNMQFEGAIGLEDPVDIQFKQPTFEGATGLEDPVNTQFEQPTFEGATRLEDSVDTQFEQPTSEGATRLEDLGNAPVEPSVEEAINAQNTSTGSSGGKSEEDVEEDDQGEDTFFRLSEGLDMELGNVSNEGPNQQNVNVNAVNSGLNYGNSDDLRSMSSGDQAGATSNSKKEVWFDPSTDMEDSKFQI